MHLILTGATGSVGLAALQHCLSNPTVTRLSILSRRPVAQAEGHEKAKVILHKDYLNYTDEVLEQLKGAQGCVWAQGISQTKVDKDEYVRITHDFPLAAAKSMATLSDRFNFVYVSGEGADPTEQAYTFFGKIKGRTEKALLSLPSSSPSLSSLRVYNVRPGFVDPSQSVEPIDRPRSFGEKVLYGTLGPLLKLMPSRTIPADKCGEYLVRLAMGDGERLDDAPGIEAEGRTIRNVAMRREMGLSS